MSIHAYLPPSSAASWSKCALWATMNSRYPQESSEFADEGTCAHWVCWESLAGRQVATSTIGPKGQIVTDEMIEGAQLMCETIRARMSGMVPHIEERVGIPLIHSKGTPDIWGISSDRSVIELIDYKFGHGFVDEWWNPQMLCYLAGILEATGLMTCADHTITVNFTIVQPRCYYKGGPVRTHSFKFVEARPYFNQLANAAEAANVPNPTATTNPKCGYCPGRHACSALQLAAYNDAEYATARTPLDLSPESAALELKMLLRALERLSARVNGLQELTLVNIKQGKRVPYFHTEQGYGRTQWSLPEPQIITIGQMFGVDLSKPGVVTPAQAKKIGVDEAVIKAYSITQASSLKLVADNPADARKVFG